jgi:hypothetical protein
MTTKSPLVHQPDSDEEVHNGWETPTNAMDDMTDDVDSEDGRAQHDGLTSSPRRMRSRNQDLDGSALGNVTIEEDGSEGVLPRDKQKRTAFFDHAAERQMSHSEAKQIYQRHQQAQQTVSDLGYSPESSTILPPNVASSPIDGTDTRASSRAVDHMSPAFQGVAGESGVQYSSALPFGTGAVNLTGRRSASDIKESCALIST